MCSLKPDQIILATKNRTIIDAVRTQLKNAPPFIKVILIEEVTENNVLFVNSKYDALYKDQLGNMYR